ncbi:MAG: DNA internalization-related competence protein ComEC/Rec2 [Ignavibacteria bacterium]|nr:DNA internalization-related competence protein ComEC/Rec2 [Ignavibacteria bacterium]
MSKNFLKKHPPVLVSLPFASGILISFFSGHVLSTYNILNILLLGLMFVIAVSVYKYINRNKCYLLSFIILIFLCGFLWFQFRHFDKDIDNVSFHLSDEASIRGIISEMPEIKNDKVRLLIKVDSASRKPASGYVLATVYKNKYGDKSADNLRFGDVISLNGKLEKLPGKRNPGEFDYGHYLRMHNIDAVFIAFGFDKITFIEKSNQGFYYGKIIYPFKRYSMKVIDKLVGGEEGEYLKGLVLGERSNISKETKENFINAGVAHIIAVSGLNVAYVTIMIWALLTFIPIKHSLKIVITILCLIFYMNLTGNVPSIVRATVMASVLLLSGIFERKPNAYNIVCFAAVVILIYDPRQLFDAGFILSFSAIFSLIIIYPILSELIEKTSFFRRAEPSSTKGKAIRGISALFLGTFAAQIGMMPITAIMFKKVSIVSLLANLFAIPLSNVALGLGFIMILLSFISNWLASVFASVNQLLLWLQLVMIDFCASLDWAFVETYFVDGFLFIIYYAVLALILTLNNKNYVFNLSLSLLLIINFILWRSVINKTDKAEITYLDAGNFNSALIRMPEGTSVLINSGSSKSAYYAAERNVIPYIKSSGISAVDLFIVTKMDKEEFRNVLKFLDGFKVKKMLIPIYYKRLVEDPKFSDVMSKTNISFVTNSEILNRSGKFRIYVYYDSLLVSSSMMVEFVYGKERFVFDDSDDAETEAFNRLNLPSSPVRVFRASGPGSFSFTSAEFIGSAFPEFLIISPFKTGRRKLNTEIFSESLELSGVKVLRISETGAVIFRTDGRVTEIKQWR